jgi:exodeoxyribonuclease V alpha subunit
VLGDLTGRFIGPDYPTLTRETGGWLQSATQGMGRGESFKRDAASLVLPTEAAMKKAGPLADHAVILTKSYRSAREILAVSTYVNNGETEKAFDVFAGNNDTRQSAVELDTRVGQGPIVEWIKAHFTKEIIDRTAALKGADLDTMDGFVNEEKHSLQSELKAVLDIFDASRILTFTNAGPRSRIAINLLAEKLLRLRLAAGSVGRFFHGQQVMISRNLHDLDLFNGDTGMVVQSRNSGLKVVFRRGVGGKKYAVHPLERLIGIESAFAMTVHKAQGSEFGEVMLVLPEKEGPLLTRQVLYTGITRAKNRIVILGSGDIFRTAIDTREERPGGIVLD